MKFPKKVFFITSIILLQLTGIMSFHATADTLHVVTHDRTVVVTDPSKGVKDHRGWGVFPDEGVDVRRIVMYVTFGCPDTMRCADWDYSDRIQLERAGGVESPKHNVELARLITPYGGFYRHDWTFTWEVDVTDFSQLLRDSAEVNFMHSGYEPNHDRGWLVTITFEIITGPPVAIPLQFSSLWDQNFVYGDPGHPIEESLMPVSWKAHPKADFARLRVVQTGHGMDKPDNCAEFCSRYREIWFDGEVWDVRQLWKACGWNPVYPQAGTWIFDRGNWCPGEIVTPEIHDLPVSSGSNHTLKFVMEPYTATEQNHGAQVISAYLIHYQKPQAKHDATLLDVVVPSDKDIHSRRNPASANPVILIKNNGSDTLRSLQITYGTQGYELHQMLWEGVLPPLHQKEISLEGSIQSGREGQHRFLAYLSEPNGSSDEYLKDNSMSVNFTPAPLHGSKLIFHLLTNNQPEHNAWKLITSNDEVVYEREPGSLTAATLYSDTFNLMPGAYRLIFEDTAGDGLEFWFNRKGGRGEAKLIDGEGMLLKAFDPDFGSGWVYSFFAGDNPLQPDPDARDISLYPSRTSRETTLRYFANRPADLKVQIVSDPGGEIVQEMLMPQCKEGVFNFDLTKFPYGRFYVIVTAEGQEVFKRRIRFTETD